MTRIERLRLLHRLGMDARSERALLALPLVELAWDGDALSEPRHRALVVILSAQGQSPEALHLIRDWLTFRPTDRYFEVGRAVLASAALDPRSRVPPHLAMQLPVHAGTVASAGGRRTGGRRERAVLKALQRVLGTEPDGFEPDGTLVIKANRYTIAATHGTVHGSPSDAVLELHGNVRVKHYIPDTGMLVGSSEIADLHVEDGAMAPVHSKLTRRENDYFVEAVDAALGTRVNGERVGERRLLGGETLRLTPDTTLLFKRVRDLPRPPGAGAP